MSCVCHGSDTFPYKTTPLLMRLVDAVYFEATLALMPLALFSFIHRANVYVSSMALSLFSLLGYDFKFCRWYLLIYIYSISCIFLPVLI